MLDLQLCGRVVVSFAGKPLPGNVSVDLHTSSVATLGTVFAINGERESVSSLSLSMGFCHTV
jgi:hypothetical protein